MAQLSAKLRSISFGLRGDGISFWCPGCDETHAIRTSGVDGGWTFDGNVDEPTFSPSILVTGKRKITEDEYSLIRAGEKLDIPDRCCHSFVRAGHIEFLSDCTHAFAGKTVPLPDLPAHLND